MPINNLNKWLEIAKSAALVGGAYLLENQSKDLAILHNAGRDIKLQIDTDTEILIKAKLSSQTSFPILGEETGKSSDLGEFYWVVDPLDGTSNYLRNIPISCVSIALMRKGQPQVVERLGWWLEVLLGFLGSSWFSEVAESDDARKVT